jgi:hypothetical protein
MLSLMSDTFSALESSLAAGGAAAALDQLALQLREEKKYHELFEALKLKVRHSLGLPLLPIESNSDELPEATRNKLEEGLVDACRQVGELLLKEGKVREGWMYLRPVGDKAAAASLINQIEPNEDNTDELIEVLLHEGVDTGRGFALLLERNGTCNSITTFDQLMHQRTRKERQAAAACLLNRLYTDLIHNVKADIARQAGEQPKETTLKGLVADRDWLFQDGNYHIDTTHLASVVRMSRVLEDPEQLRKALDLTHYGRHLSQQLQYQGDEPFADQYPSNALYYQALLGENVDEALAYFENKARLLDPQYNGTAAIETYLELLSRLGRYEQALAAAIELMPDNTPSVAYAPLLMDLCEKSGNYQKLLDFCRSRGDELGFAAALVSKKP